MNIINLITTVQWCLGILGLGLYGGIEQAEGWQILINMVLTLTTGITIWMLGRVKEVIINEKQKRKSTRSTKNMFDDEEIQVLRERITSISVSNKSASLDFTILANGCAIFVKRKMGEYVIRITGKGPIKENKVYLALRAREILLDAVTCNE